jgi:indolepyruvate ferredoxin oxidoreductase
VQSLHFPTPTDLNPRAASVVIHVSIRYLFHRSNTRAVEPASLSERGRGAEHNKLVMDTIQKEILLLEEIGRYDLSLEARTPSYCAGCPHRGSSSVIRDLRARLADSEYMRRTHDREPVDVISHGGIGCYSLNFLPPFRDMHNMAAMGLGGAAGMGAYPFTNNKHYVMCGDSTFFHSEMSTLSNAIKDNQDILYIILDNKNTAMTGHQTTPASAYDVMGYKTIQQDIESVVRGMDSHGKIFIRRIDPSKRDSYMSLLEDAFLMEGVRVIIADRECGITYHKRRRAAINDDLRRTGFRRSEKHINITPEVCENCRECTLATGCPGLTVADTPYGEKIGIDQSICVDDKYCTKIKACPSFEQVIITRRQAPLRRGGNWDLWMKDLPVPAIRRLGEAGPEGAAVRTFQMFVAGVGGMGLGFIAKVLTEAGAHEGYHVNFYHQKGLAQRNGAVVSHVLYSLDPAHVSQRIPEGKADLIIGLDYLETARGLRFAHEHRTAVVCNTAHMPTITMLMGEDRFPIDLEARIRQYTRRDKYFGADFFALSEHYFGNRVYANVMMLGVAYQRGLLPMRDESIEEVLRGSVRRSERENNLRAFRLGRRLVTHPEMMAIAGETVSFEGVVAVKSGLDRGYAERYTRRMTELRGEFNGLSEDVLIDLARRYHDLVLYEHERYADRFLTRVREVYRRESSHEWNRERTFAASKAVIWNLYKAMAIKDEIWVAHLLTSEEKMRHDRERYGIDPKRGDRIRYLHINRPHFDVFGVRLEWDMKTRNWMLHLMKRLKFIRRMLPAWHNREKAFRDWYDTEVVGAYLRGGFASASDALTALGLPSTCTGYRDVVYPKHEAARKTFDRLCAEADAPPRIRARDINRI